MAQAGYGPPSLPVGTEVSAKYRGAFCEAKVKSVVRIVRCKIMMKDCQSSIFVTDEEIKGPLKLGAIVEVKHPDTGQPVEATINKLIDHSTYTVVFDDGDERTLRRTQLCLKGDKHFIESETLDNLPLSHPEHFGTPVLQSKKGKRKSDEESDDGDTISEEESPRRAMYRGRHQELVGKLMLVDLPYRKGSALPALVVLPDANSLNEVKNRDQILVRSFKDSKFTTVTRKDLKEFTRVIAIKNDDKTMRTAFEKALLYFDTKELPVGWDREEMLGSENEQEDDDVEDEYASEDEPFEEKDRFVAQLYKFMDDRGTPINKGPCIGNKDLNLYKLFKIVQNFGGYNKVTKEMKWSVVYSKMGLPSLHVNPAHQIKTAYKKYLDAYETFYRKLGSTMGTLSRPGRARQNSGRSILNFRGREKSPRSPKPQVEKNKQDTDNSTTAKVEPQPEKVENISESSNITLGEESEQVVRRVTPRRDNRTQVVKDEPKDKKEDISGKPKKEEKKEDVSGKAKQEEKKEEIAGKAKKEDGHGKAKKEEKKEEGPSKVKKEGGQGKAKKEEKKEEVAVASKVKKEDGIKGKKEEESLKKEERKSTRKIRLEEDKEGEKEKEEKKPARTSRKEKEEEKKEEVKQEDAITARESPKKRITRRKLLPAEPKKEIEGNQDSEKKEAPKKAVTRENRVSEKKEKDIPRTLERRDSRASEKKEHIVKSAEKKEPIAVAAERKEPVAKIPERKEAVAKAVDKKEPATKAAEKKEPIAKAAEKKEPVAKVAEKKELLARAAEKKESVLKAAEKKELVAKMAEKKESIAKVPEKKETITNPLEKREMQSVERKMKVIDDGKKDKKGKESDEEEEEQSDEDKGEDTEEEEKTDTLTRRDFPVGSRLRVKYGRGKNQKIYIAKVVDTGKDGTHKTYLVHYAGWNTRYDEWIRPERVVSILERPDLEKIKHSVPNPMTPISSAAKKLASIAVKSAAGVKPGSLFRTPKNLSAKTRATRSTSSELSLQNRKPGKRITRRRSALTNLVSPGSRVSSDTDDATGSEKADDVTPKEDDEEEILDVEENEGDGVTKISPAVEVSVEAGIVHAEEEAAIDVVPVLVKEEKCDENNVPEMFYTSVDKKVSTGVSTDDVKEENEEKHSKTEAPSGSEVIESAKLFQKAIEDPKKTSGDWNSERATVCVAEVNNAVDEIRSVVNDVEIKEQEETETELIVDQDKKEIVAYDSHLDSFETVESPRLKIVEDDPVKEDNTNGNLEQDVSQVEDKIPDDLVMPTSPSDQSIPHLKKIDIEPEIKEKDGEKGRGGMKGRRKDNSKDVKKSVKTSEEPESNLAQEIPTLELVGGPGLSSSRIEPSPYDFDAELESHWQPEITKKWEPTQKTIGPVKESDASVKDGEEKDKKKVKKKIRKKPISPEFIMDGKGDEKVMSIEDATKCVDDSLNLPSSGDVLTEKPTQRKKGRKRKELSTETKKEVIDQYECTVNSVVEAVKHSLQETEDHEQKPSVQKKRRTKKVSESDKKELSRAGKAGKREIRNDLLDFINCVSIAEENNGQGLLSTSQSLQPSDVPPALSQSTNEEHLAAPSHSEHTSSLRDNKEPSFSESQGFEPQMDHQDPSAPFDNTPPTTPEHDEPEGNVSAPPMHQQNLCNDGPVSKSDNSKAVCSSTTSSTSSISLPASSSNIAQSKSASESPSDNEVTSTASTDNLDSTMTAQHSESSGTEQDLPASKKRKPVDEHTIEVPGSKKKKRVHGTRSRTAKKSPKYIGNDSTSYKNSDSQGSSSTTPNHYPDSPPTKYTDLSKSPRPSKFNFSADLGEYLEGEARCNFLISKMKEIKTIYMNLKSEVASIDRRRKRARRKERESSQVSTNDREGCT